MEDEQQTPEQVRIAKISKEMKERIPSDDPVLSQLKEKDIQRLLIIMLESIVFFLLSGKRVVFENYFSIFTKPIKRRCSNLKSDNGQEFWMTHKNRIRFKLQEPFRKKVEKDI